jgi:phosphatidylglycerol---prolipoprotein diacylglyceryl transferase
MPSMSRPIVWDVDPVLVHVGPFAVRYYGICFGLAIVTAFVVWYHRVRRYGETRAFAEEWLWWGVPATIIGGRLGFCLFYAPRTYLEHPLQILYIWQGGIASHGVGAGLIVALWAFGRRHRITWTRLADYFAPALALGGAWIRLGNFFNSEVLGQASSAPWAVVFLRRDTVPRHPVQLYEMFIGPVAYLVLRAVERRAIRPVGAGLVAGTYMVLYSVLRMFVEQFKAIDDEPLRALAPFQAAERLTGWTIHTGQWLCVAPLAAGLVLVWRALRLPSGSARGPLRDDTERTFQHESRAGDRSLVK